MSESVFKKICKKCNTLKLLAEFSKRQNGTYLTHCKQCKNLEAKEYRLKNKEEIKARKSKNWSYKEYSAKYKDSILIRQRKYYLENKEKIQKYNKEWSKTYRAKNIDKIRIYRRHYEKNCMSENNKLIRNLRNRINSSLSGLEKSESTIKLLGCTIDFLKEYLELKFTKGMTWENRGISGWHVDHIKPCSSFDLSDPEQQKICFHYTNLQPLWATTKIAMSYGEDENYIGNLEKKNKEQRGEL